MRGMGARGRGGMGGYVTLTGTGVGMSRMLVPRRGRLCSACCKTTAMGKGMGWNAAPPGVLCCRLCFLATHLDAGIVKSPGAIDSMTLARSWFRRPCRVFACAGGQFHGGKRILRHPVDSRASVAADAGEPGFDVCIKMRAHALLQWSRHSIHSRFPSPSTS